MENKKSFVLDSKSLKIKEVLNQDFLGIEIYAISEGDTRNPSVFTLDAMKKSLPTFFNKFILGYFKVSNSVTGEGHFEEHNSDLKYDKDTDELYWSYTAANAEKALGMIRESDTVEIVEHEGKKWIKVTAVILTKYNREAVKHLLKSKLKRKISVEVTIVKSHKEGEKEVIEEFILDGITILGTRKNSLTPCQEGIAGASMTIRDFFSTDLFNAQKKVLKYAYDELDEFQGLNKKEETSEISMDENIDNVKKTFEDNEKEGITLTYEQKREVLEQILRELKCSEPEHYVWVADLSDTEVYYCFNGQFFKASYVLDEEAKDATINIEEEVEVIRSWEVFVEQQEQQVQQEESTVEEGVVEQFSEQVDDEVVEHKDEEKVVFVEDEEEVKEDNEDDDIKDEEEKVEEEKTEEEKVEEDEHLEEIEEEKDAKEVEVVEEKVEENVSEQEQQCKTFSAEEYEALETKFNDLMARHSELETQYNSLTEEIFSKKVTELCAYGETFLSNEEEITDQDKDFAKGVIDELQAKCHAKEIETEEQVEEFMTSKIGAFVYKKRKNSKNENIPTENFSARIENQISEQEVVISSVNKLKNVLKNL